jgi:hypothetical protein
VKWHHGGVPSSRWTSQLGAIFQIVGGHPDFLLFRDALLMEVGLTAVDERLRIGFAIVFWKIHLLE